MHQSTVNDLVFLSKENDAQAFRKLVEAYQPMVYSLAFRLLCNADDAKDIVQETFIKAWRQIHSFNTQLKFSTWLYSITAHHCYDKLRKEKRHGTLRLDDQQLVQTIISNEDLEKTLIEADMAKLITALTTELTPKQKLVFTLRDLEGLEIEEIKTITSLSAEKIKSNLYLARQYIRKKIESF